MKNEELYRIHWESNITGATGQSEGKLTFCDANASVSALNEQSRTIYHWVEPVPVVTWRTKVAAFFRRLEVWQGWA